MGGRLKFQKFGDSRWNWVIGSVNTGTCFGTSHIPIFTRLSETNSFSGCIKLALVVHGAWCTTYTFNALCPHLVAPHSRSQSIHSWDESYSINSILDGILKWNGKFRRFRCQSTSWPGKADQKIKENLLLKKSKTQMHGHMTFGISLISDPSPNYF